MNSLAFQRAARTVDSFLISRCETTPQVDTRAAGSSKLTHPDRAGLDEQERPRVNFDGNQQLAQLGTFEALTAVVVLLAKAEASPPSQGLRRAAQDGYLRMQERLLKNPKIAPAIEEVFVRIDEFFLEWVGIHDQMQLALPMQSKLQRERKLQ